MPDVDLWLEYLGESMTHVRAATYNWISTKRFRWTDPNVIADQQTTVMSVVAHPQYRDHYTSPDSVTKDPIHGPYRLSAIRPNSFDAVTGEEATQVLWEWLADRDVTS